LGGGGGGGGAAEEWYRDIGILFLWEYKPCLLLKNLSTMSSLGNTSTIFSLIPVPGGPGVGTALLVGRPRDRFPMVSLGIFPWYPQQNHVPWGRLSLWKWVPGISPGVKAAGAFGWRPTTLVAPKRQENPGS